MFSLCMVPDSSFNLSYTSLTSCEAQQAILDTHVSDPEFYAELMATHPPVLLHDMAEEDPGNDGANNGDMPDVSTLGLEQAILHSRSPANVAAFLDARNTSDELDHSSTLDADMTASKDPGYFGDAPRVTSGATGLRHSKCSRKAPTCSASNR